MPRITLRGLGQVIFALAIIASRVENLACARMVEHTLGPQHAVLPVLPWLPAIPWVAYLFGSVLVLCAAGLLSRRTESKAVLLLGSLLFLFTIVLEVPKYAVAPSDISLRTIVFEPLSLACLAFLLLDR